MAWTQALKGLVTTGQGFLAKLFPFSTVDKHLERHDEFSHKLSAFEAPQNVSPGTLIFAGFRDVFTPAW